MSKKRLNRVFLLVLLVTTIASLATFSFVEVASASPAYETFTQYTETDPNSHITVTNSTHITSNVSCNEDAYVYQQRGIDHFAGNFAHRADIYVDNATGYGSPTSSVWALTDKVDDRKGLEDADESFLSVNVEEPSYTFGFTSIGGSFQDWEEGDDLVGCQFTSPAETTIVPKYIHFYGQSVGASPATVVKMAIYKNSDLSFVCQTGEVSIDGNVKWRFGAVTSYVTLEASTVYLLCVWADDGYRLYYDAGAVAQTNRDTEIYNGFPATFTKDAPFDQKNSIYCTYRVPLKIELEESYGGVTYTDYCNVTFDTWYYLLMVRAALAFQCGIYSSSALRNVGGVPDIALLNLTLQSSVSYDYIFAVMTYNDGSATDTVAVQVKNYDFQYTYSYTFYGLYDEVTGARDDAVNVTAHFSEGYYPETFEVNGTYVYQHSQKPLYFSYDLVYDREYWLSAAETSGSIYVFNASTTVYTIEFIDLTNQLDAYSFVSAKRLVNGTLHTIEKRKANQDDKVVMALIQYGQYSIYIRDGVSYDYGQVVFTTTTTVQLTLTGLEFPSNIVEGYKYVRCWAYRNYASPNTTTVNYQDLQSYTTNVTITHYFINGTVANATWSASNTFISTWTGANENTTYYVVVNMTRSTGTMTYRQTLPRAFSSTNPWGIDFLWASAPFNTNILLPAFIIVCVAGVFSALNTRVGALATVATAIVLMAVWSLSITQEAIILALALVIMMGVIYGKRRVMVG